MMGCLSWLFVLSDAIAAGEGEGGSLAGSPERERIHMLWMACGEGSVGCLQPVGSRTQNPLSCNCTETDSANHPNECGSRFLPRWLLHTTLIRVSGAEDCVREGSSGVPGLLTWGSSEKVESLPTCHVNQRIRRHSMVNVLFSAWVGGSLLHRNTLYLFISCVHNVACLIVGIQLTCECIIKNWGMELCCDPLCVKMQIYNYTHVQANA